MVSCYQEDEKWEIAAGPSGIVAEMLKASGAVGVELVATLANAIVRDGRIPSDWEDSFIINCYNGKGELQGAETSGSGYESDQEGDPQSYLGKEIDFLWRCCGCRWSLESRSGLLGWCKQCTAMPRVG